jgi:hypothetical protein
LDYFLFADNRELKHCSQTLPLNHQRSKEADAGTELLTLLGPS